MKRQRGRPATAETTARRRFIERWVVRPEVPIAEIAKAVDCSRSYVILVARNAGLLEEREGRSIMNATKMLDSLPKMLLKKERGW